MKIKRAKKEDAKKISYLIQDNIKEKLGKDYPKKIYS